MFNTMDTIVREATPYTLVLTGIRCLSFNRETAVEMSLLQQLDTEILIGQVSYNGLKFTTISMGMIKQPRR